MCQLGLSVDQIQLSIAKVLQKVEQYTGRSFAVKSFVLLFGFIETIQLQMAFIAHETNIPVSILFVFHSTILHQSHISLWLSRRFYFYTPPHKARRHTHGIRLKKSLRATSHQSHWISFRVYFWGTPTVCAIRSFVVCSVWFSIFLPLYRYCDFFVVVACFTLLASYSENCKYCMCIGISNFEFVCTHTHIHSVCAIRC